jgi:hypothetical protein
MYIYLKGEGGGGSAICPRAISITFIATDK